MRCASAATLLLFLHASATAQSLDELPPDVAAVSKALVSECRKIGGKADYEPLELVKLKSLSGQESYIIDSRALRCKGGKNARKGGRLHCRDDHCQLVVMVPGSGDSFAIAYRDKVSNWSVTGNGGLVVEINNENHHLKLENGSLIED